MVTIYEVRYPDSRRGARGEPPFSTALFRSYENADNFASRLKGAQMTRKQVSKSDVDVLARTGYLERQTHRAEEWSRGAARLRKKGA